MVAMFCCRVRTAGYAPARGTTGDHVLLQGTHCRVRTRAWDHPSRRRAAEAQWAAQGSEAPVGGDGGPGRCQGGLRRRLVSVSRFLNFPIVNRDKSFRIWTSDPTPRAGV